MNGAGKYDKALTEAVKHAKARQGVLIIIDGEHGGGFSVQAEKEILQKLPDILENMAKQIRVDNQTNGF